MSWGRVCPLSDDLRDVIEIEGILTGRTSVDLQRM